MELTIVVCSLIHSFTCALHCTHQSQPMSSRSTSFTLLRCTLSSLSAAAVPTELILRSSDAKTNQARLYKIQKGVSDGLLLCRKLLIA